jgi:prepilin-type N-terminal cleavage/methylation domain-containing protein
MNLGPRNKRQPGFTLIELLVALGIFLLVTGAAFTLLGTSQKQYQTESQVLNSFQEARLGLDQIVRDVNDAGYPPPTYVSTDPAFFAATPFAWSPGYPNAPCQIATGGGGNCATTTAGDTAPGDFDLIIETNAGLPGAKVQWIRYQLQGTILMRGTVDKASGQDPDSYMTTNGQIAPFVQNVVNVSSPPGGAPVPIFTYTCDTPTAPQPQPPPCAGVGGAGPDNSPRNIRDVTVTLIVAAPLPDATTGATRTVQLTGRGRRINPN